MAASTLKKIEIVVIAIMLIPVAFSFNLAQVSNVTQEEASFETSINIDDCGSLEIEIEKAKQEGKKEIALELEREYEYKCVKAPKDNESNVFMQIIKFKSDCDEIKKEIEIAKEKNDKKLQLELEMKYNHLCSNNAKEDVDACKKLEKLKETYKNNGSAEIKKEIEKLMIICKNEKDKRTKEDVEEEIRKLKEEIRILKEELERTRQQLKIMAQQLNVSITITPGEVEIEGEKVNISDAEIVVDEDKNISVVVKRGEVKIKNKEIEVKVKGKVKVDPTHGLTINNTPIKVEPIKIKEKVKKLDHIKNITLEVKDNEPVYVVEGEDKGRLLGIIPVKIKMNLKVNAINGEIEEEKKPWWSMLVFG